jgi:hypothetical protein
MPRMAWTEPIRGGCAGSAGLVVGAGRAKADQGHGRGQADPSDDNRCFGCIPSPRVSAAAVPAAQPGTQPSSRHPARPVPVLLRPLAAAAGRRPPMLIWQASPPARRAPFPSPRNRGRPQRLPRQNGMSQAWRRRIPSASPGEPRCELGRGHHRQHPFPFMADQPNGLPLKPRRLKVLKAHERNDSTNARSCVICGVIFVRILVG